MMRMMGWQMLGMALIGALLAAGAAVAADNGCSTLKSGYMSSGSFCDHNSRHVTPCSACTGCTAKTTNSYTHAANCATAARYSKADVNCLFDTLRKDHRMIGDLMAKLATCEAADRSATWSRFRKLLLSHMQGEERTLYPALEQNDRSRRLALQAEEEHAAGAEVFQKLDAGDMMSDRWGARFAVLREMLNCHVEEEQTKVFAAARKCLSDSQLRDLCAAFVEQKEAALASLPAMVIPMTAPAATSPSDADMARTYDASMGFDDLGTQNMTLHCSACGAAMGTVCPWDAASITLTSDTPAAASTPAAPVAAPVAAPAAAPAATAAQPVSVMPDAAQSPMGMYGMMHCPSCGAAMGSVCSYTMQSDMTNGANGGAPAPKQ